MHQFLLRRTKSLYMLVPYGTIAISLHLLLSVNVNDSMSRLISRLDIEKGSSSVDSCQAGCTVQLKTDTMVAMYQLCTMVEICLLYTSDAADE